MIAKVSKKKLAKIKAGKENHNYPVLKEYCETCGKNYGLTPSHFVKEKSIHPSKSKDYDYYSQDNYFTQCLDCHILYEKFPVKCKLNKPLFNHARTMTRQYYLTRKGLNEYSHRVNYLITDSKYPNKND